MIKCDKGVVEICGSMTTISLDLCLIVTAFIKGFKGKEISNEEIEERIEDIIDTAKKRAFSEDDNEEESLKVEVNADQVIKAIDKLMEIIKEAK